MPTIKSPQLPSLTATRFNQKEYQIQRKNHFEIEFISNGVVTLDSNLKFMLVSFSLPKESTETSDMNYFNQTVKVAGKTTFDTIPMVLRDAIHYDTELKFLTWRKKVYDPETAKAGIAADYKIDAIVYEYTPNGEECRKWKIVGCWPASVEYGELTHEDGGEKSISVTLAYDYGYRIVTES